jgi:hypothetical protein
MPSKPNRVSETDLKLPALLAARDEPNGRISTTKLISKLRLSMNLNSGDEEILPGRNDDHFSQIVRNIKSHKNTPGNLIAEGLLTPVWRGFQITDYGRKYLEKNGY